jgi:hypothetical protein
MKNRENMKNPPTLTDEEWQLILELLERERSELPPEIHHTDTTEVLAALRQRLEKVERLIGRIREAMRADSAARTAG